MRIEFDSVEFKNFLSFGSKWQEIVFQRGINIITGKNGSGKSSCMETIPFALFGKTHKNIKKADLINWKNRKGLEVKLKITKGNDIYTVLRAIKPDNFEIYENGSLIEKESHVRDYQSILEEIIGINFQTFISLSHSNINTSQPIFSMSKPDKRKFIEKIFGLSIYSKVIELCNKKLIIISNKIRETEIIISNSESNIGNSKRRIEDVSKKIGTLRSSVPLLNDVKERLKEKLEKLLPIPEYESIKKQLGELVSQTKVITKRQNSVESRINIVKAKIRMIEKKTPMFIDVSADRPLKELRIEYDKNVTDTNTNQEELRSIESTLQQEKFQLNEVKKKQKLLDSGTCPTCGQSIHKNMIESIISDIDKHTHNIEELNERYKTVDGVLTVLINLGIELITTIEKSEEAEKNNKERVLLVGKTERYKRVLNKLSNLHNITQNNLLYINNKQNLLNESYDLELKRRKEVDDLKMEFKTIKSKVESEDTLKIELEAIISLESKSIENWNKEIDTIKNDVIRLNNMKDYLDYIKIICSDNNIKSHAISSIIPVLSKNMNTYLSDIGRPFYIQIDNWLEPTVKGPGIPSGSYDNLSSGEAKSVDLSLQNAFLDVARIQAGVFPDILIYDELLDSSLDNDSLDVLLSIISRKQREDDNKVYIISHRNEISEIEAVNTIKVVKEGGYSKCLTT